MTATPHPRIPASSHSSACYDWSSADTPLSLLSPPPLSLPMTYTPSFGAGCYGNRWHAPSRSSPDRAGNYDIAGSGSGSPSYSQYGSRSTRPGERLQGGEERGRRGVRQTHTCRRDKGVHTKPHVSHTLVYHQFDCGCAAERVSSTVTRSFCVRMTAGLEVTCDGFNTDAHKCRPYYTQGARPLWAISRLNSMPSQLFQI